MKKGTSVFLFLIAFLGTTLLSCKLKVEDTTLYDKPGVKLITDGIQVIITKVSTDTKYLNIYRRDKADNEIICISLMTHPLSLENDNKTYCFIDKLVKDEHSYDYRVRYNVGGEYFYTEWSDIQKAKSDDVTYLSDSINLSYQTTGASLRYQKSNNTLKISGTITEPDFPGFATEGYTPMLIIQSETATQTFELADISDGTLFPLNTTLPSIFLDTDLTIKGIVGQKIIYDDDTKPVADRKIVSVIWTEPATINLSGAGSSGIINIPSETGSEGLDYSE